MSFIHTLKNLQNPTLAAFLRDQRLPELFRRREFRFTEAFLHRELCAQACDEEILDLDLALHDGYAEVRGTVKMRLLPAITFTFRVRIAGMEFNVLGKRLHLAVEQVKPVDLHWVTRRLVERVPFLSYADDRITVDLERVPSLAGPLNYRAKGVRPADFFTLRDVTLRTGEVVGRLGILL
jgi:hypothetical protein